MSRQSNERYSSGSDSSRATGYTGMSHTQEDGYRFSLVNGQVSNLQEFDDGRWKNERIDLNEAWTFDGTNLIQQEAKRYGMEISTYSDPDGDGVFSKTSEVFNPAIAGAASNIF